jgi:uncharacterized lipoprotein NlpE involved in copper resistance
VALSSDRRMIVLMGRGEPEWFALPAAGTLRKLDMLGRPIESKTPLDLRRASMLQPLDVRLPLRGTYLNMADAATFLECSTGQRFPVAMEGANRELESTYAKVRPSPGAATLVEVEGRLAARPRMEGAGTQTTLVVDKVVRWLPKERCLPRFASAPLADTQWRLTHLGGTAVPACFRSEARALNRVRHGEPHVLRYHRLQPAGRAGDDRSGVHDAGGGRNPDGLPG